MSDWLLDSIRERLGLSPNAPLPPTVSVDEAAVILSCSRGTAYGGVRDGTIDSIRLGTRIRVPLAALISKLADSHPADAPSRASRDPLLSEASG